MVSAIRALTVLTAVVWFSSTAPQVSAQVAGPTLADRGHGNTGTDHWYPYRGTVQWTIGPDGQPVMRPSNSPVDPDADGPSTSRIGWQAPVLPASPVGGGHTGSSWQAYMGGQLTTGDAPGCNPRSVLQADSCCSEDEVPVEPMGGPGEPVWWESAWNATTSGAKSSTDAVVGAFNWARLETRDALKLVVGPDRLALRPLCRDCGRRHFPRRR